MPEAEWIIQRGEERYPVADVSMIRDWAQKGNLLSTDQIWSPTKGAWVMARDLTEISDLMVQPTAAVKPMPQTTTSPVVNSIGIRFAAVLIDVVPAIVIGLIGIIPVIGQFIAGVVLGCYWLFRDVNGASLGKLLLGLVVVQADGQPSTSSQRIKRNVPLCIGHFLFAIPIIGYFIGLPIIILVNLTEVIMLLTQGHRLGDRFAGTTVVRKAA